MKRLQYWIKMRVNPQLGTYFIACGQMTKKAAKDAERTVYGFNVMHAFDTEEAYIGRIAELRAAGATVQINPSEAEAMFAAEHGGHCRTPNT